MKHSGHQRIPLQDSNSCGIPDELKASEQQGIWTARVPNQQASINLCIDANLQPLSDEAKSSVLVANMYQCLPAGQKQGWQIQMAWEPHNHPCQALSRLLAGQQQIWDS